MEWVWVCLCIPYGLAWFCFDFDVFCIDSCGFCMNLFMCAVRI